MAISHKASSAAPVRAGPFQREKTNRCGGFAANKTDKKPFLVIISIAEKKKKIKKTQKVFAASGHFLRFREFSAIVVVKTDGHKEPDLFTFVDKRH